ncbi:SHOCT domain-containing protein [Clostridium sp. DL1XJH146]
MMIFILLGVAFLVYYLVEGKGSKDILTTNRRPPEDILRERFANGEIDEKTYIKMKQALKQ